MQTNQDRRTPAPQQEPTLVLFDMDGVLFDTMPTHAQSWFDTATHYGLHSDHDEFYLYEGQKGVDTIRHIYFRQHGKNAADELVHEIYDYKTARFSEQIGEVQLIPGVYDLMKYLYDRQKKIGVVTGSSQRNSLTRLDTYYGAFIDTKRGIITADSVTHGKPHPEPYIKGMELFGKTKEQTAVIENAPYGVKSGAEAGAYVIAVTTGPIAPEVLYDNGANIVLPDMRSVHDWWEENYGSAPSGNHEL